MVAHLRQVLNEEERRVLLKDLGRAPMVDGRTSAGVLGQNLKVNAQIDPHSEIYRSMVQRVLAAMGKHKEFSQHAMPRRVLPPVFARYRPGSYYQRHVDNAFMGPFPVMRTDLSITIFLNDPKEYAGGALSEYR
jgi:PKHD-type hydroxylase